LGATSTAPIHPPSFPYRYGPIIGAKAFQIISAGDIKEITKTTVTGSLPFK